MVQPDQRDWELQTLQERLSRLSEASLRLNGILGNPTLDSHFRWHDGRSAF